MQPCNTFGQTAIRLRIHSPFVRLPIHLLSNLILTVRSFAFGTSRFILKLALGQQNLMKNRLSLSDAISLRRHQSCRYHEPRAIKKIQPSWLPVSHTASQPRQFVDRQRSLATYRCLSEYRIAMSRNICIAAALLMIGAAAVPLLFVAKWIGHFTLTVDLDLSSDIDASSITYVECRYSDEAQWLRNDQSGYVAGFREPDTKTPNAHSVEITCMGTTADKATLP